MTRAMIAMMLGVLSGLLASTAQASDFKENPDRWQCAFSYNAGGRAVWVYGDTVQWKPDAIATAQRLPRQVVAVRFARLLPPSLEYPC